MKKSSPATTRSLKRTTGKTKPIKNKEEVQQSNDERIDEDFPGFPHPPSTEEAIVKKKKNTAKQ